MKLPIDSFQDPEDVAYEQWAVRSGHPATGGNAVTPYIYGEDAFADMAADLAKAKTREHFIYLLGFETSVDTPMGGSTLGELLSRAAESGVMIRGIFNGDGVRRLLSMKIKDNASLANHINTIGGKAYLDNRVLPTAAHHQKLLVVCGEDGLVAYCGGVDVAHPRQNRETWHDVHCRIVGPAAYHLFSIFKRRWTHNAGLISALLRPLHAPKPPAPGSGTTPTYTVQIARTWPYQLQLPYAPWPERTIYQMILNAIRRASRFIYVEDQFMVCRDATFVQEIKTRLSAESFQCLIILTNIDKFADWSLQGQAAYRRKLLIDDLREANPDKVIVCTRKDPMYVHAKTWIFDDTFAIIGSANMNNRGYFSDSEVVAGIADRNEGKTRLSFAHRLRMALWMKHLDITAEQARNPETALEKWRAGTASTDPYVTSGEGKGVDDDVLWHTVVDPR